MLGHFPALQITVRDTARIPIVQFKDPLSGLHVDICGVSNLLALRNTALLRAYSTCDPRFRPLAFFLKHWYDVHVVAALWYTAECSGI